MAAYLAMAMGDALGATVEFMTPREIQAAFPGGHRRIVGGGWLKLKPGGVTDDTGMALALGRALLAGDGEARGELIAWAFDQWMRDRPVDIGNTVRRGILHYRRTGETRVPPNAQDAGNGACMRVLPVALATWRKPLAVMEEAALTQARVTHNNPLSDRGTVAICAMVRMALHGASLGELIAGPMTDLAAFHPGFAFRGRKRPVENPSGYIVETLATVFEALADTDNVADCLVEVVNRGGDADTTGAIAGMVAGALHGPRGLPKPWLAALRDDVRQACTRQAAALMALP